MEYITHTYTEILFQDNIKILTSNVVNNEIIYTEIEKLENEQYNLEYNCDILKVKSYQRYNKLPDWY
jgi:hypothetical protein